MELGMEAMEEGKGKEGRSRWREEREWTVQFR